MPLPLTRSWNSRALEAEFGRVSQYHSVFKLTPSHDCSDFFQQIFHFSVLHFSDRTHGRCANRDCQCMYCCCISIEYNILPVSQSSQKQSSTNTVLFSICAIATAKIPIVPLPT